jgi:Secretion system C-terminal sorting domain
MKKIFYAIIGLWLGINSINAQTTFNKLYPAIGGSDIQAISSGKSVVFVGVLINNSYRLIALSTLDNEGREISRDTFRFRSYSIDEARFLNTTIKTNDNNYLMAAVIERNCSNCKEGLLAKFNSTLSDTLWTKTYKYANVNATINTITENTNTHQIYTTGDAFVNNTAFAIFSCFDANGNLLWEKKYDRIPNVTEYIEHIEVVGNYLVLGGQQWTPNVSNSTDGFIAVYDLNGNYLYRQNFYHQYSDVISGLLKLNDHEVLAIISEGTSVITNGINDARVLLERIDLNTNTVVQSKYIGVEGGNTYGKKPVFLDSNKIIFAGNRWDVNRNKVSSIYAISTNLDSLWHHEYPNEIDPQNYIFWSQDAQINSTYVYNNSIFTAGEFFTYNTPTAFPPGSPNQYAWVMKLDTLGCLTPNCWTSVENGDPNIWIADNPLGLYPNPANTQVTLRLVDAPLPYQIDIFDAHGKLMFNESHMASDATISTIGFPNGTYFCRATYADKRLGMAKFIVQH